jgi:hypothetical protein
MVFGWQDPLDRLLAAEGYATRDETLILAAPAADIAEAAPTRQLFRDLAPPRRAGGDLGRRRHRPGAACAVMRRAEGPKTALFGRINDRPAGTAFIAVHGKDAMLHALEVASRPAQGLARLMMRAGAAWAAGHRAPISPCSSPAPTAAQGLYASLGLKPVENYHYRVK